MSQVSGVCTAQSEQWKFASTFACATQCCCMFVCMKELVYAVHAFMCGDVYYMVHTFVKK